MKILDRTSQRHRHKIVKLLEKITFFENESDLKRIVRIRIRLFRYFWFLVKNKLFKENKKNWKWFSSVHHWDSRAVFTHFLSKQIFTYWRIKPFNLNELLAKKLCADNNESQILSLGQVPPPKIYKFNVGGSVYSRTYRSWQECMRGL